ncbi:hypothetical protein RIVM261_059850 [Rivularia sp. IAM M-261]|nr:hypothetical protein CAL7716_035260 [Calothrix sp. PCC 7716]GJD21029.1 hypothetical protein RIVM261_059850 [Rivularia sp. IAM M-261]
MDANNYLLGLAKRNVQAYVTNPKARAAMVTGSVAEGECDFYSDIDISIYYDELPTEEELESVRHNNQGSARLWFLGDRSEGGFAEAYKVNGVECQFGHVTINQWEHDMATVLEQLDVTSWVQKALSGIVICIPLYGEELINHWKQVAANYPDALAVAMVKKHLQFFGLWGLQENYFVIRDGTLWQHQVLVETVQNILGVLAGLNQLYYSTFQFKRMGKFIGKMYIVPNNLYLRLENIFKIEPYLAAIQLKELIQETVVLVELQMPQIDTSLVRRKLDWRHEAWKYIDT